MHVAHRYLLIVFGSVALLPVGCREKAGEGDQAPAPGVSSLQEPPPDVVLPVETWTLSDAPILEIGVREEPEEYQLHRVMGSLRLEDGRIVVLNAGSRELRYFDPGGRFLLSVGHRGEGPGEFESPVSLRRTVEGDLQVWDRGLLRGSIFEPDGAFRESFHLLATREEMFPGDDWLLGRNWIVSPVPPGARDPIRRAVERMPAPDSAGILRLILVTPQGRIWSPRQRPPTDAPVEWSVYDLEGRTVAHVTTPARFQPHEIGEDYITGLYQDELDVDYVRLYRLIRPAGSPPGPGLDLTERPMPEAEAPSPPSPEVLAGIRSMVKSLASLEEIHYSENYTYTTDLQALLAGSRARIPQGLQVDILFAGTEGWAGMVTHPESGGRCVLAYGFFVPMGWQPGSVICL
jgi:hypothetical protein